MLNSEMKVVVASRSGGESLGRLEKGGMVAGLGEKKCWIGRGRRGPIPPPSSGGTGTAGTHNGRLNRRAAVTLRKATRRIGEELIHTHTRSPKPQDGRVAEEKMI